MIVKTKQYATGTVAFDELNRRVEFTSKDGNYRDSITYNDEAGTCTFKFTSKSGNEVVRVMRYDPIRKRVTASPMRAGDLVI